MATNPTFPIYLSSVPLVATAPDADGPLLALPYDPSNVKQQYVPYYSIFL